MFDKITIVGMGLLGGSLGMGCRQKRLARKVVGVVRRTSAVEEVLKHNAADEVTLDICEGVASADLVVMAIPMESIPVLARQARAALSRRCIVTDVGSVKGSLVLRMERLLKSTCHYVGGHPMAGSEKSGIAIASPTLFEGSTCILTPTKNSSPTAVRKVRRLWEALGCRVVHLTPRQHDISIALVSHLPHVAASSLVNVLAGSSRDPLSTVKLAGKGFKDTTRIAAASPKLWAGICIENRDAVLRSLEVLREKTSEFAELLKGKDREGLEAFFQKAKDLKDRSN
ncbi:prephenate dehydrogenase/arogenate dehydrogenase family protein [bacterium]|nr:prephenate dehydrogenase/arogenate dehydrogenase family protein [bacterium]